MLNKSASRAKNSGEHSRATMSLLCTKSICTVNMSMFTRFDKIPSMVLPDIQETTCSKWMDGKTDGQCENRYPQQKQVAGGIKTQLGGGG